MTPSAKKIAVKQFRKDLNRAEDLFNLLVAKGGKLNTNNQFTGFLQPDRRDIAQSIFFEVAAKFEAFAFFSFQYAVARHFRIPGTRTVYVMGNIDRGTDGVFGWASPERLKDRGPRLFGKQGFFGRFNTHVNSKTRNLLKQAHILRNRVAHDGKKSRREFETVMNALNVPRPSRRGMSVGRLLMDYPIASPPANRLFFQILKGYAKYIKQFNKHT